MVTYQTVDRCSFQGSYLVSVKTNAKLDLVRAVVTLSDSWVGMDCLRGPLAWTSDGEELTSEQKAAVLSPGEPNDSRGSKHCVKFSVPFTKLNDIHCGQMNTFMCEKDILRLTRKRQQKTTNKA
ncbi:hypothetical protein RRG08_016280 [Elysia crispata]|uniref:C-type lectin domain-containing protein n=1 Tax=Elysia crispata TaxID=231223 RepID=A0AAE1EBR7_9GAST|nr:hypothetical protein RRG08_016280 [Elysia crispata]